MATLTTENPRPTLRRLDGIDTLRGLAILAVILLHTWIRFRGDTDINLGHDWPSWLRSLVWHNGGNGVTVFFAVSGFLITLTSLRRFGSLDRLRPAVFYRIRFARIMPLLLLLLAVLSVLHLCGVPGFVVNAKHFTLARALFAALTFHLNWLEAARDAWLPACWTVLWSLSIEEMFYLFFPLVSLLLMRRGAWGRWAWFAVALVLIVLGPFARTAWAHTDLQAENSYLGGMSDIAVGCVAAWLADAAMRLGKVPRTRTLRWMQALGWLPILWFATWPRWQWLRPLGRFVGRSGIDDTLLALGTGLICAAVALRIAHGRPWTAPLRWMGRLSYEFYLSHEFVVMGVVALYARWFAHGSSRATVAAFVLLIVLGTLPLAWALERFFTAPLNRKLRGARMAGSAS